MTDNINNTSINNLNIEKLNAANKKIENLRKKTYDQVKKECYNRINIISQIPGKLECWYIIPKLIVGFPPIDIEECSQFLKNQFDEQPIIYEFFSPNLFYITWDLQKIEKSKKIN